MKERYNDGQCVVEGLAGEELRQIVASPDTGEAGDTSQVTTQHWSQVASRCYSNTVPCTRSTAGSSSGPSPTCS